MLRALRNLVHRRRLERELKEEVGSYEAMLRDEHAARGLSPAAARRAAAVAMGGCEHIKEATRAARAGFLMQTVAQDVRFGWRLLRRSPGVSALAVVALALGIGANTALFSLVRGVLLQPLPYPQPERLAMVFMDFAPQNNPQGHMSMADFFAWRANNRAFLDPALITRHSFAILAGAAAVSAPGARVTASFFTAFEVAPKLGRVLQPGDDRPASTPVVVVSESFWREQLSASPAAIGRAIKLDGAPFTVVGVMPSGFHFPGPETQVWANLPLVPPTRLGPYFYAGVGRLKPGVTLAAAQADTNRIGKIEARAHPQPYRELTLPVVPLREAEVGNVRAPLLVLMGAVGLVLLIAIVNVAGLLLARAQARQAEMAVRVSLGAGAARLLRQLLTEGLLLALAGGAAGVALAGGALAWLRAINPDNLNLPRMAAVHLDGVVLAVTLGVAVAAGLLLGLAPGWHAARSARGKRADRGQGGGARSALVVAEFALALVLLCGAGVLLHSLARLEQVDSGAHAPADQVFATTMLLRGPRYNPTAAGADPPAGLAFDRALLQQAQRFPGVQAAAISDSLPPFRESDDDTFTIQGQAWTQTDFPSVPDANVSPGYFAALGIPLLAGRDFSGDDTASAPPVIIISAAVARRHFPDENPLGHYIKDGEPGLAEPYARIVGVVGDAKYQGLEGTSEAVYRPVAQDFNPGTQLLLRSHLPTASLAAMARAAILKLEPEAVVGPTQTLEAIQAANLGRRRFPAVLLGAFALLALTLAAIGIYGVMAYSVSRRTREIGVRLALGARSGEILGEILSHGMRLALAGVALGLAGALALTRLLAGLLFETSPGDPAAYAAAALGLAGVALVACLVPAWRAARTSPAAALRQE